jgi:IrrE N-terminal-like domain
MRNVTDTTGRFSQRPHYEPIEIDRICERVLLEFFGGNIPFPIPTDELTKLIERDTEDFDPGADLEQHGADVEGVTLFKPGHKPKVQIAAALAYDEGRQNRYRTTLTHEWGHVHLHTYLFEMESRAADLFNPNQKITVQVCKRDTIQAARKTDWMEWQAGYVCGALLMPISQLRRVVGSYQESNALFGPLVERSPHAAAVLHKLRQEFQVSEDCARVRLRQTSLLHAQDSGPSLFA